MRGPAQAALLLAPALAAAHQGNAPAALIQLATPHGVNEPAHETLFRLNVLESEQPCGHANVLLDDHPLEQNALGVGSGSITTGQGSVVVANWKISCLGLGDDRLEQLMEVQVESIDGQAMEDETFTVQFKQTAPVRVTSVDGTGSVAPDFDTANDDRVADLEAEIMELEFMKMQLVELEQAIFMKEHFLAQTFGFHDKISKVTDCDSLKCIFLSVYDTVKETAGRFYEDGLFGGPHAHGHNRDWEHDGEPGFKSLGRLRNHTHDGNHTLPRPPFHHGKPPHFKMPPFCHCEPPHHGPDGEWAGRNHFHHPHGAPDGEHGRERVEMHLRPESHGSDASHHRPDQQSQTERPHQGFGSGKPQGPPEDKMPFDEHRHYGSPPFAAHDEDPGMHRGELPPPPPEEDEERPLHIFEGPPPFADEPPPPPPYGPPHGPPPPPPHGPPPPFADGPPPPPPPGLGPHGPPHGPPFGPGGPGGPHHFGGPTSVFRIFAVVILMGFLISALNTRCFSVSRASFRARREERRSALGTRRGQPHGHSSFKATVVDILDRLKESLGGRTAEDEEKEAMLRQVAGDDGDSDAMSTTMEDEIAQLRNAAGVVDDMVAAEEGRAVHSVPQQVPHPIPQQHMMQPMHQTAQPMPMPMPIHMPMHMPMAVPSGSAFPECVGIDEALPSYDDTTDEDDSSFVADGMMGGTRYTPSDSSGGGSLDDVLGRKD